MKPYRLVLVAWILNFLLSGSPANAITGGTSITSGTSNVVAVISKNSVCSGALLSPRVVVTAGHCVVNQDTGLLLKDLYVSSPGVVIPVDNNFNVDETWATVQEIRITSNFENISRKVEQDDIAFLALNRSLELPLPVFIASPSLTEDLIANRSTVRIFGYGATANTSSNFGGVAQRAEVTLVQRLSNRPTEVWLSSDSASLCRGDSGGPVVTSNVSGTYVIGIMTGSLLDPSGSCGKKQSDGKYYSSATLLSGYANLAFEVAQSVSKLVESQVTVSDAKAKEYGGLLEKFLPLYEDQKALAESRLATIAELSSRVDEMEAKAFTLKTFQCQKGKKRVKVTSSIELCPAGYKVRK
jgi:secreted trypsin-like serine protease